LDLALGIIHQPRLLFLDEPSIGLDPQSRARLWEEVRKLHASGTTVFLTTHYLEEADSLCNRLAIIDGGKIAAEGTPEQLKQQIASDIITLRLAEEENAFERVRELLQSQTFMHELLEDEQTMHIHVEHGEEVLATILRLLTDAGITIQTVSLARPSLDDVFLR